MAKVALLFEIATFRFDDFVIREPAADVIHQLVLHKFVFPS